MSTQCHNDIALLEQKEIDRFLNELKGNWHINKLGYLYKNYMFVNFIDALNFANKIAEIAEKENHHPNLTISYGQCIVEIWTHRINGLTKNDFILAAKIDNINN